MYNLVKRKDPFAFLKRKVVVSLLSALISVSFVPWAAVTDFVNFPEKKNKFEQNNYTTFIDLP